MSLPTSKRIAREEEKGTRKEDSRPLGVTVAAASVQRSRSHAPCMLAGTSEMHMWQALHSKACCVVICMTQMHDQQ